MSLEGEAIRQGAVPDGWNEEQIDFFQFEKVGDEITGRLVGKIQTTIRGNRLGKYTLLVKTDTGSKKVAFLGSVDLDEKMANIGVGNYVKIVFLATEPTKENYEMRRFRVFWKRADSFGTPA